MFFCLSFSSFLSLSFSPFLHLASLDAVPPFSLLTLSPPLPPFLPLFPPSSLPPPPTLLSLSLPTPKQGTEFVASLQNDRVERKAIAEQEDQDADADAEEGSLAAKGKAHLEQLRRQGLKLIGKEVN